MLLRINYSGFNNLTEHVFYSLILTENRFVGRCPSYIFVTTIHYLPFFAI